MKFLGEIKIVKIIESLPLRGAWIEIGQTGSVSLSICRRSLCGERGLKYCILADLRILLASLPLRGAWIEIVVAMPKAKKTIVAPFAGSVD